MQTTHSLDDVLTKHDAARLLAFRRDVVRALPDCIDDIILFGSRARGDAGEDSDYDVAIMLRGSVADDRAVRRRIYDLSWDYMVEGFYIQPVVLAAQAFHPPRTELPMRIAREGVLIR
jgi:predicted nucleotidyltransferase